MDERESLLLLVTPEDDNAVCVCGPKAFEFSEWLLLQIHEHVHSCQYGNFLGNNQRQREELQ